MYIRATGLQHIFPFNPRTSILDPKLKISGLTTNGRFYLAFNDDTNLFAAVLLVGAYSIPIKGGLKRSLSRRFRYQEFDTSSCLGGWGLARWNELPSDV